MKFIAALLALGSALAAPGCVAVPPEVEAEFSAPDGVRPNNYHACPACARAKRAGKPGGGAECVAR